jgi:hypothetical protein
LKGGLSQVRFHLEERRIEVAEDIITNKRNQLTWEVEPGCEPVTRHQKYGHLNITEIKTKKYVSRNEVLKILNEVIIPGRKYYTFSEDEQIFKQIIDTYEKGECGFSNEIMGFNRRVETILDEDRQHKLLKNYHTGKTNKIRE